MSGEEAMKATMKKFLGLTAVLFAFAAGACDSTMVSEPAQERNALTAVKPLAVYDASGTFYLLPPAKTYPVSQSVVKDFDSVGGTLQLSDFAKLVIPKGAVTKRTQFAITVVMNGYVELQLTALQKADGGWYNAGAAGFAVPVYLHVNSAYANLGSTGMTSDGTSTSKLTMLWEVGGTLSGTLQNTPSTVNSGWVVSTLSHFSEYVMASN
jgi:hypothetical protein